MLFGLSARQEIVDVRIAVYLIEVSEIISKFSSFKSRIPMLRLTMLYVASVFHLSTSRNSFQTDEEPDQEIGFPVSRRRCLHQKH